jgi:hypothetical protein
MPEQLPAHALLCQPLRDTGDIEVLDIRWDDTLRVEEGRQGVTVARLGSPSPLENAPVTASERVRALKTVVFPLCGRPTMTNRNDMPDDSSPMVTLLSTSQ